MMKKEWLAALAAALVLTACQKTEEGAGPAEQAGRKIDQVTEKTGQELTKAAQEASEKLNQAAQDAKARMDQASDHAGEKIEQVGQKMQDGDGKDSNNKPEESKAAEK